MTSNPLPELAEALKAKLALEDENRKKKIEALHALDTKKLINMLPDLEDKLEAALRQEVSFRDLNVGFLSSGTSDCAEVKRKMAELQIKTPEEIGGKKPTAAEREAWLVLQRADNTELAKALERQKRVAFELENLRIDIEMAKKRLENIHRVLGLRTAQIQFLTETHG